MKIAWVSSWPPRHCGIATYSSELVEALRRAGNAVHVICHPDGGKQGEKHVYPVIDNERHGWDETLYDAVKKIKPDVIHIQHEFGLYRTSDDHASGLLRALFRWKVDGKVPVVITYHSVYTELSFMIRSYMDVVQRLIDAGIVHAFYQWAHLHPNLEHVVENVYVIPHGAAVRKTVRRSDAKKALGLEGRKVAGMIGWFNPTKGFDRVLPLWDELSERLGPDAILLLAGDARPGQTVQNQYKKKLLDLVEKSSARERIKVVIGSFSPEEYEHTLTAFDVMVMPYTFASQSGNLAHSFSLGVPVVAAGIEGLKAEIEASGAGVTFAPGDDAELKRAIISVMEDDGLRRMYAERATAYVKKRISWPITAEKHMRLYRKLLAEKKVPLRGLAREALLEPDKR
jgi:glycosyltransferase involved in cell wall biosynthesis